MGSGHLVCTMQEIIVQRQDFAEVVEEGDEEKASPG